MRKRHSKAMRATRRHVRREVGIGMRLPAYFTSRWLQFLIKFIAGSSSPSPRHRHSSAWPLSSFGFLALIAPRFSLSCASALYSDYIYFWMLFAFLEAAHGGFWYFIEPHFYSFPLPLLLVASSFSPRFNVTGVQLNVFIRPSCLALLKL